MEVKHFLISTLQNYSNKKMYRVSIKTDIALLVQHRELRNNHFDKFAKIVSLPLQTATLGYT